MKRTQRKDAYRNIKRNIISFFSLCLVISMGLGGLFSLKYMSKGISERASEYYEDRNFKDFELLSSFGAADEDVEKISKIDGVNNAEGVLLSTASLTGANINQNVTLLTLTEKVSVPELTEGRLPVSINECMIGEDFAADSGLKPGDIVRIVLDNILPDVGINTGLPLVSKNFLITGLMHHPDYLRRRSVNTVVIPLSAVDKAVTRGFYTRIFVDCDESRTEEVRSAINNILPDLQKTSTDRIRNIAKEYTESSLVRMMLKCRWVLLDRDANAGFIDVSSNIRAMDSAANIFGGMFMIIAVLVCFSTLVIIIDGQKKLVGTVKAFGFHKKEILGKYILYGLLAALIGDAAGIGIALSLSGVLQKKYASAGMYSFGVAESGFTAFSSIAACLFMIVLAFSASILACREIMKTSASGLMNGVSEKKHSKRQTVKRKSSSTLYVRLVFRNMLKDKARVIVSIGIIAFSCMLIGMAFSLKASFNGMSEKEINEIYLYDFRLDMNGLEDSEGLEKIFADNKCDYLAANYSTQLCYLKNKACGMSVLCADSERIGDFFSIRSSDTKEKLELPADGILIQNKLEESYGLKVGTPLRILDTGLSEHEAKVSGEFQNYVGRLIIVSPKVYSKIFGKKPENNCYYVKLNGADKEELTKELVEKYPMISFEADDEFVTKFESISRLYDILIYIAVGIAIMMSFLVLANLADIFVKRKKKELAVMRINGFTISETVGYLANESIITTVSGVIIGVLIGIILNPFVIKKMEQPDLCFDRSIHPFAWIIAGVITLLFAVIVYTMAFWKIRKLSFRDIE